MLAFSRYIVLLAVVDVYFATKFRLLLFSPFPNGAKRLRLGVTEQV